MRPYEIVYVLDAELDQDAAAEKIGGFHETLGGEVDAVDHWGVRRLAYPIAKARMAYYVVAHVRAEPSALPEFERRLRLDEQVVRYLVVLNEGQSASGDSTFAETAPPAGEDDAGEEGDGEPSAGDDAGAGAAGGVADAGEDEAPALAADSTDEAEPLEEAAEPGEAPSGPDDATDAADAAAGDGATAAEGDAAGDAASSAAGEAEEDAPAGPAVGPPEFSGTRGRGRRHDAPRILLLNYKDVATLSYFVNEQGKILPKRTTKVTARFQRELGTAVKRARFLALLPYIRDHEG